MLNTEKLLKRPRALRALTGLTYAELIHLSFSFEQALDNATKRKEKDPHRQRKPGGGKKSFIQPPLDKLIFILVYWKLYPTQDLQGVLFGLCQSAVCKWVHRLIPLLEEALGYEIVLPLRPQTTTLEGLREKCPELNFIIDGTERPVKRPKNEAKQKARYSGKKKRHTVKNTILSDAETNEILFLGDTKDGKIHDKKAADEDEITFPKGSHLDKDSGYKGYEPDDVLTRQPKKKPKGRDLTEEEKHQNREISKVRIRVEHAIGGIKIFRIASDIFRNRKIGMEDKAILLGCGLHNYRRRCRRTTKMAA